MGEFGWKCRKNRREKLERELVVKREGVLKLKKIESSTEALKLNYNRLQVYVIN